MNTTIPAMTILSDDEARGVLSALSAPFDLVGELMYLTGLRLQEVLELRVRDVELTRGVVYVRRTNGACDRFVTLSSELTAKLSQQLERTRRQHAADLKAGVGAILPLDVDERLPLARTRWCWQYVFFGRACVIDPMSGERSRPSLSAVEFQKALRVAADRVGVEGAVHSHSLRHACAARWVEQGLSLADIQARLGHTDLQTTALYARTLEATAQHKAAPVEVDRAWIVRFDEPKPATTWFERLRAAAVA